MPAIIQSLKASADPHLYLLYVGLSETDYRETEDDWKFISEEEKADLARRIVDKATDKEALFIIQRLVRLEFSVEKMGTLLSKNRLAGHVIRALLAKHEGPYFCLPHKRSDAERKQLEAEELKILQGLTATHGADYPLWEDPLVKRFSSYEYSDYPMSKTIRSMWFIINDLGRLLLEQPPSPYLSGLPHLEPIIYSSFVRRGPVDLVNLTNNLKIHSAFRLAVTSDAEEPDLALDIDLCDQLLTMKAYIINKPWQVGNYFFFSGGVYNEGVLMPHRVSTILNMIKLVESGQKKPKEAYDLIVTIAAEALASPRTGRQVDTTRFYQAIYEHRGLDKAYISPQPKECDEVVQGESVNIL